MGDKMDGGRWTACREDSDPLTHEMLATIRRHMGLVLPIVIQGGLAGVVHGAVGPQMRRACEQLGWDGLSPVFRPTPWAVANLAHVLRGMGDEMGYDFLLSDGTGRIAVFSADEARMFQYDPSGTIGRVVH